MPRPMIDPSVVIELTHALRAVEDKVDAAMQEAASFTSQLIEARLRTGVPVHYCQAALESASLALAELAQARRSMIKTHDHMYADQLRLGMRHVNITPIPKIPPPDDPEKRPRGIAPADLEELATS